MTDPLSQAQADSILSVRSRVAEDIAAERVRDRFSHAIGFSPAAARARLRADIEAMGPDTKVAVVDARDLRIVLDLEVSK